ncbi:MAG: M24 family metallopeptidase [Phycisphaerales bacterium]|nr:M24 family metallopeptidase [Phycisphaerales bacterium]
MTVLIAGIPSNNDTLFHAIRFSAGDPAALIDMDGTRLLIIRDIEMDRAKAHARADQIACPADFTPNEGLSGDRETAVAQSVAEALRQHEISTVRSDRTLALSFIDALQKGGISIEYDHDLGVAQRRSKDAEELDALRSAQAETQAAIAMACETIANASPDAAGVLQLDGGTLTSDRVRALIDTHLLTRGYDNPMSIVAGGSEGADCHHHGASALRTGEPVIIDVFPRCKSTRYNGDCTRTVVHGDIPPLVQSMYDAVSEAKLAGESATRAGVTGEVVHQATTERIMAHGFHLGLPEDDALPDRIAMVHGTGHGVGLAVHEPPLLDIGGPPLVAGDVITIEPGLYGPAVGGLRLEDMVVVTQDGQEDLGTGLHLGLDWATT